MTPSDGRTETTRRIVLVGTGTALTGALAGCLGDDDGSGDTGGSADGGQDGSADGSQDGSADADGDGGDGSADGTGSDGGDGDDSDGSADGGDGDGSDSDDGPTVEDAGEVGQNAIDELELVGWESSASGDIFQVTATVRNGGDQATDPEAYTWGMRMYDDAGGEVTSGASISAISTGDDEIAPGDTGEVLIEARPDDASVVARYELFLTCGGQWADGVYCSN